MEKKYPIDKNKMIPDNEIPYNVELKNKLETNTTSVIIKIITN